VIQYQITNFQRYNPNEESNQQDDMIMQLARNLGFGFGDNDEQGQ
jgi:hypothetical protein